MFQHRKSQSTYIFYILWWKTHNFLRLNKWNILKWKDRSQIWFKWIKIYQQNLSVRPFMLFDKIIASRIQHVKRTPIADVKMFVTLLINFYQHMLNFIDIVRRRKIYFDKDFSSKSICISIVNIYLWRVIKYGV